MANLQHGSLIIVSAPSGSGKTSLLERVLREVDGVQFSVSHTTRAARQGEVNGRDYFFVDDATFDRMIERGEFLEYANVYGQHRYGTSLAFVERVLATGQDLLLDIDVQGARQVGSRRPEAVLIFILPPSFDALEQRLRRRNLDSDEMIQSRLRAAQSEIDRVNQYDYVIINDDIGQSGSELKAIILAERSRRHGKPGSAAAAELAGSCRLERRRERVTNIVETFHRVPSFIKKEVH